MRLINKDCFEAMDKLIDEGVVVDLILTDPPYGTTQCAWDSVLDFAEMWKRLNKLIKPNGAVVLFGSEPFSSALRMSNMENYKYDWIWEKNYSGGFILAKKRPMKYHENISIFYIEQPCYNPIFCDYSNTTKKRFKNSGKINSKKLQNEKYINEIQGIKRVDDEVNLNRGKYPSTVLKIKGVPNANGKRVHPTQKPIKLLEYLIRTYTNETETVLDFTMGSGSTGVACKQINREFIGIELDKSYFDIAVKRIETTEIKIL